MGSRMLSLRWLAIAIAAAAAGLVSSTMLTGGSGAGADTGTLPVTVVSQTSTTITLGWTPPAGAAGYEFTVDGKRVSNTWSPNPTWACPSSVTGMACVKFASAPGHSYGVIEVVEGVSGSVTVTTAGTTTTAPTTTALPPTTTATTTTAPSGYEQAIAYTQTPPPFTVKRDVPVASSSQLQQAVAAIQCGDRVHATAPITVSSEWQITAAPACPAVVDLTGVTVAYTGSSALPSVWINGASNLRLFGGDIHGPAKGQPGAGGIAIYKATNLLWWGFHVHDVAHDGLDLFPIGGPIDSLDLAGEIDHWGGYIQDDPHAEKATGFHGVNIADAGTGIVTNSRFAFDLHDGPAGAGVEIGSGSSTGRIAGITMYLRAQRLTYAAVSQVAGNAVQWWGAVPIQMTIPYLEASQLQGRATDGQGVYSGVSMSGVHVDYGRATSTNLNLALARTEGGIAASDPWDKRHGEQYGDIGAGAPPTTTAASTTTSRTTPARTTTAATTTAPPPAPTTTTNGSPVTFQVDYDDGTIHPFTQNACSNYQGSNSIESLGPWYLRQPGGQGASYGEFNIPADTSEKQRCQNTILRPTTFNATEWFGLMLWVPASWAPGKATWGPMIAELNYQTTLTNATGKALALNVQDDHVTVQMATGKIGTSPVFPNETNADQAFQLSKCKGVFLAANLCSLYAIPPGKLVKGAWNEIIIGDHFVTDNTGWVQAFYKVRGSSTWTQSLNVSGIPTLLYDAAHDGSGKSFDSIGLYRGPASTPLTIGLDDFVRAGSFATAAAALP